MFSIYAEFQVGVFNYTYMHSLCDKSGFIAIEHRKIYLLNGMNFIFILPLYSLDNVSHSIYSFLIDKHDLLKYRYIGTSKEKKNYNPYVFLISFGSKIEIKLF